MKKTPWDWIGIIGGIICILIGVVAVIKAGSPKSNYIAIAMVVVFGGMGYTFFKLLWEPRINARRLKNTGVPCKAKILEVHDTNITINNNPQLKLVIEVKNDLGQMYTATCKMIVSRLNPGHFKPGMEIAIKIDPKNEKNVIVADN